MGGIGSGRWRGIKKSFTVEDGLTLSINELRRDGFLDRESGSIVWLENDSKTASVGYRIIETSGPDSITLLRLQYALNKQPIVLEVKMANAAQTFGGVRRRFVCPLLKNGVRCNRRCEK